MTLTLKCYFCLLQALLLFLATVLYVLCEYICKQKKKSEATS